jgi:hypothetical protein
MQFAATSVTVSRVAQYLFLEPTAQTIVTKCLCMFILDISLLELAKQ